MVMVLRLVFSSESRPWAQLPTDRWLPFIFSVPLAFSGLGPFLLATRFGLVEFVSGMLCANCSRENHFRVKMMPVRRARDPLSKNPPEPVLGSSCKNGTPCCFCYVKANHECRCSRLP